MTEKAIIQKTADAAANLALDTLKIGKQALIFINAKKSAEKQAEGIARAVKEKNKEGIDLKKRILKVLTKPTKQCIRLGTCLEKGIAFHHSGLHQKQRKIIEDGFREGQIKIICTTPTLAAGLDLPAFRVILRDTKRYSGSYGMTPIPVLEYLQMIGRCGRPKFDSYGEGICIAKNQENQEEIYRNYVLGEPENIQSKLSVEPVLRTCLLSLISSGIMSSKKEINDYFKKTFWAHQYKDMHELMLKIENMLELLAEWGFLVKKGGENFVSADEIDQGVYQATRIGKRVSELYLDPLTAFEFIQYLEKATKIKNLQPISFLQVITSALEIKPKLRVRMKEFDYYQEQSAYYQPQLLKNEPPVYEYEFEEYLCELKTAMMLEEWLNEKDEEYLTEKYSTTAGEIHTKLEIGNWLLYTSSEIAEIKGWKHLKSRLNKLRTRLKYGVKEELLPLVKIKNIGRARARVLFKNNIKDMGYIRKADINRLALLIGTATAIKIKEEIGEKIITPIKIKRSGQTSLTKKWQN